MPLLTKTVWERSFSLAESISAMQVSDITAAVEFSIACGKSCDVHGTAHVVLGRYMCSEGLKYK